MRTQAIIRFIGMLGVFGVLTGCGTDDTNNTLVTSGQCPNLTGKVYYTPTLEVGGLTIDGASKMHWQVRFGDGEMTYVQTDTLELVPYSCSEEGEITTPSAESLTFSEDLSTLTIDRFGQTLEYRLGESEPNYQPCGEVAGRTYATPRDVVAEPAGPADIRPAMPMVAVTFGQDSQQLTYTDLEGKEHQGLYECTSDQMHIHLNEEDINPIVVVVNRHGVDIQLTTEFYQYVLDEETVPVACLPEYDPVCAIMPTQVQCLVAPCQDGVYKTAASACIAESNGWAVESQGECGQLEDTPHYPTVACTKEYDPVCAAVGTREPCTSVPCPARVHKTYGNSCEAQAAQAFILQEDECSKLEGTPVVEPLPGACTQEYDPVCAKVDMNIQCVTTPCPSFAYQSFGNQCGANLELANVAFKGECGNLDGSLTDGQPPAIVVEYLPAVEKSVNVVEASIADDVLSVTLGYSGCDQQHFSLYFSNSFLESNPVQAESAFVPMVEDACEAYFTTEFQYDLRPLKHAWQEAYREESGEIILRGGLGRYVF